MQQQNQLPSYPSQPVPPPTLPQPYPQTGQLVPRQKDGPHWALIIPLILFVLLFLGAAGFGFWAFAERADYKNNVDQKVAAAVKTAEENKAAEKEKEFLEREKTPYKVYKGPATFGSVEVTYPKTWAASVDETGKGGSPISGYFHPNFVPGERSGTAFGLRLEVLEQSYDQLLSQYENEAKQGKVRISPYKAPKVAEVLGARVDGEIERGLNGSTVMFPIRDKTIKISTQSPQFVADFDSIILAQLIFSP